MIGDKRYTEALEDILVRQNGLVGERCSDIEAGRKRRWSFYK